MLVGLFAVFAFGAVGTAVAQATEEEAPFWSIGGTRLAEGKTHYITAKVSNKEGGETGKFVLTALGVSITCTKLTLTQGVLLGSNAGNPGTNDETIVFTGCTQTGNGVEPNCVVKNGTITTNPIKSELVLDVETHKKLLVTFAPVSGAVFATIEFEEKEPKKNQCPLGLSTKVEGGETVGEVLTDPKETGKSYLLNFPSTNIEKVLLVKNNLTEEHEIKPLRVFGKEANLAGVALILLANTKKETELIEWSPLL